MTPSARLKELGIDLPTVSIPLAAYVPWTRSGDLVFVSGQLPMIDNKVTVTGHLGRDVDIATAQEAARLAGLRALGAAAEGAGGIDQIRRIVKVGAYVASAPGFNEQHIVANGASDVIVQIMGDAGRHARFAIGLAELPLGACVEIEMIAEVAR